MSHLHEEALPKSSENARLNYGIIIAILAGCLGLLYGYDSGTFSAALPFWKNDFHLTPAMEGALGASTILGITLGVIFGGRICDAIGRQKMMVLILAGFAVAAILGAIPISAWWLIGIRILLGVFIGFSQVAAPLFIAEFAPEKIRGALLVSYMVTQTLGHVVATYTAFFFVSSGTWEIVIGLAAVPAILLLFITARFPDTPRWYMLKGFRDKARETLSLIEPSESVESRLDDIAEQLEKEKARGKGRLTEIFDKKFSRRLVFACGFGFFVHITGMTAVNYYGPVIFQNVGFSLSDSLLLNGIVQVVAILAELSAFLLVDTWGRRPTILTGIMAMVISMAVLAFLYFFVGFEGKAGAIAFVAIIGFRLGFGMGFGSLVWIYMSETFPLRLRGVGASVLLTVNNVTSLAVAQVFPVALAYVGGGFTFGFFFMFSALAWIFVFIMAPETKGRTLEEIHEYWSNGGEWSEAS